MTKLTVFLIAFLIVVIFALWTFIVDYYSYATGRYAERNRMLLSFPVIGMDIGNKNFCVDGKLNVHEVEQKHHGIFKSKKKHEVK